MSSAERPSAQDLADVAGGDETQAFSALYKKLVGAANIGDVDTYVSCYTEDGVLMPPHAHPVVGQSGLVAYMTDWFGSWQLQGHAASMEEQRAGGSVAFCRYRTEGRYLPRAGGDPVPYSHTYIDTLIKQPDGSWLIAVHMWSSNVAGSNVWTKEART